MDPTQDVRAVLATWFGLSRRVGPIPYALTGFGLTFLKYTAEAALFLSVSSVVLTPLEFLNPLFSSREALLRTAPPWLPAIFFLWTMPFLWIAVSMSIRRAADAGLSPWLGFGVLIPVLNLALMLLLCIV